MGNFKRFLQGGFMNRFLAEIQFRKYLETMRWKLEIPILNEVVTMLTS